MANQKQLKLLMQGGEAWSKWRARHRRVVLDLREANLYQADLQGADLGEANLSQANLMEADLSLADLRAANLSRANLSRVDLSEADLSAAKLGRANLIGTNLIEANLSQADLKEADLRQADLSQANLWGADLTGADLREAILVHTQVDKAKASGSRIYGVNVWDLRGDFEEQKDLVITPEASPSQITVDNIKVAQFIYLILNNEAIRDVINTLTSK